MRDKLRWLFRRRLCFGGLAGALVFFCLSLTPSLLPRGDLIQGVLSGVSVVIGYGLGSMASATIRTINRVEVRDRTKRIGWRILLGATIVLVPLFLGLGLYWQNEVRELMGMEDATAWDFLLILVLTIVFALLLLLISRLVRGMARVVIRFVERWLPRQVSMTIGVVVAFVVTVGMIQGFLLNPAMNALNSAYGVINEGTEPGVSQPTQAERSGSPDSLVDWDTLGVQGRDFTGLGDEVGPTRDEIEEFNGRRGEEPIRVYVGLDSADSLDERVELALAELDRTDAWSREVLAVVTTTGTGWVNERAAAPLEYMHNGDTAIVAMQYSFLPSWISFLVDVDKAADAGREMIDAVQARIDELPENDRPKFFVFGESLGSFGTESAFDDIDDMIASVDGALLSGPVFRNDIHNDVTDRRDAGSPFWRPVFENGEHVRTAVKPEDLTQPDTEWASPRIVYLQNSSDPIIYWNLELLWNRAEWLDDPRGPDVSDDMFWIPIVTFWQAAGDMAFSTGVPGGHGHNYGANPVDAWAAIYEPDGWTDDKTQELREIIGND